MKTKILALGDSWFHYPYGLDRDGEILGIGYQVKRALRLVPDRGNGNLIKYLKSNHKLDLEYDETTISQLLQAALRTPTRSKDDVLGACGEELTAMVTGTQRNGRQPHNGDKWLDTLVARIKNIEADRFIILLSGGGNDIAGEYLPPFLNQMPNPAGPVNQPAFTAVLNDLRGYYQKIFTDVCTAAAGKEVHFLLHGYGYPPVNGRGVFMDLEKSKIKMLHQLSPGPWLKPHFIEKGITVRQDQDKIIGDFIDQFNTMLQGLPKPSGATLHYVDLRPVTDKISRQGWCNELHFDHDSYVKAAKVMFDVIKPLV